MYNNVDNNFVDTAHLYLQAYVKCSEMCSVSEGEIASDDYIRLPITQEAAWPHGAADE